MKMQDYLADVTQNATTELIAALEQIPEDKRGWSPDAKARTPLDVFAECALLTGATADLLIERQWKGDMDAFFKAKAEAAALPWSELKAMLERNTEQVIRVIQGLPDDALAVEVPMPWGTETLKSIAGYPYWNMSYHLGQINYVASILGCLK